MAQQPNKLQIPSSSSLYIRESTQSIFDSWWRSLVLKEMLQSTWLRTDAFEIKIEESNAWAWDLPSPIKTETRDIVTTFVVDPNLEI